MFGRERNYRLLTVNLGKAIGDLRRFCLAPNATARTGDRVDFGGDLLDAVSRQTFPSYLSPTAADTSRVLETRLPLRLSAGIPKAPMGDGIVYASPDRLLDHWRQTFKCLPWCHGSRERTDCRGVAPRVDIRGRSGRLSRSSRRDHGGGGRRRSSGRSGRPSRRRHSKNGRPPGPCPCSSASMARTYKCSQSLVLE